MGKDQSDGCLWDHPVHHKITRPSVEPTTSDCKELVDNEMKLEATFIETASTNVLVNRDNSEKEYKSLGNIETSEEISDTRSGKTLDNGFSLIQQ